MSMTAFARSEGELGDLTYSVEIKSVNHRFLEVQVKLPESMRSIENVIRGKCQEAMYRGKIDVWVTVKRAQAGRELTLNPPIIKRWLLAFSDSGAMESLGKPDWQTMLNLPGVMLEADIDQNSLNEAVLESVDTAIAMLLEMRAREGSQIQNVLLEQLSNVEENIQHIHAMLPELENNQKKILHKKISELTVEVDNNRLEQEIAYLLNKSDIREELDRITFHVNESKKTLTQKNAVGRRMDFLMQEFNREANTLSAKASDNALSKAAVDLKVIIEQMREQIQNLE